MAKYKDARLKAIKELRAKTMKTLDKEINSLKSKRWGKRALMTKARKKAILESRKKTLGPLVGEQWYSKVKDYLKPTSARLNTLNRRLTVRKTGPTKRTTGR